MYSSPNGGSGECGTDRRTSLAGRQSLGGDVGSSVRELQRLRDKCRTLEDSECTLRSTVDHLKFELADREDMLAKVTRESQTYQIDLETYIAKSNVRLRHLSYNTVLSTSLIILAF